MNNLLILLHSSAPSTTTDTEIHNLGLKQPLELDWLVCVSAVPKDT